jgi:hypothetical protein
MMPTLMKAQMYKTAYSPEHKCYVSLINCWYDFNQRIVYLVEGASFQGQKMFLHTELTRHCL